LSAASFALGIESLERFVRKDHSAGLTSAPLAFWHWSASSSIRACEAEIFQRNVGKNGSP